MAAVGAPTRLVPVVEHPMSAARTGATPQAVLFDRLRARRPGPSARWARTSGPGCSTRCEPSERARSTPSR
ncbi:hypothetical protein [Saccharothrix longispora]|uniref:hypothetical protein n=1 Tax=Saccharothrix longispora TaxID=33920 RepID=UPI0028FD7933|nr:hypothetical protein [Saccharothrix longispora]MBY8847468.1 hypothetical protein [Saccharothrix sp. MB29]MDU0288788.1 hypothetical protein [Saccharothrix longispora]